MNAERGTDQKKGQKRSMFFSVLVPVYNAERYLVECVESALQQTERDFELVLVDDGSTDTSGQMCDQYAADHPDMVRVIHQQNGGLILARRAGIRVAQGRFCVFLDADDALETDALAVVRETIEKTGADIVIFNNYSFFEQEQRREPNTPVFADYSVFRGAEKKRVYRELIASWRLNNIWTKAIRTDLLQADDTPFSLYAANPHMEDLLQTLYPVTHAEKIVYRTQQLYLYRRHGSSMTRNLNLTQISRLYNGAVLKQLRVYMTRWGMDSQAYLELFYTRSINALITLFWQHYRIAVNAEQKKQVLAYDWGALLDEESMAFAKSKRISFLRRAQMRVILQKRKLLADLFVAYGNIKMRASHGA